MDEVIKSVSYDQCEILRNIMRLYCGGTFGECCDPMFGNGVFYKTGVIPIPQFTFDILPKVPGVMEADARKLHLLLAVKFDTVILDPPFLATSGKSLSSTGGSYNKIVNRFSCCNSENELLDLYHSILTSAYRLLKPGGICIFKCQDKVSSGKQYWSHVSIFSFAEEIGFKIEDLFVLIARSRMTPKWQIVGQKHARKYHSYFIVLRRPDAKKTC